MTALAARLERAFFGEPESILVPEALEEARQLGELTSARFTCDGDAAMLLATFHMIRWQNLDADEDVWDHEQMQTWLASARRISPDFLPAPFGSPARSVSAMSRLDAEQANARAAVLAAMFDATGDVARLDQAIDIWTDCADRLPCRSTGARSAILTNLSGALSQRSEWHRSLADADGAVAAAREAVRIVPDEHLNHASALSHLGVALRNRFELAAAEPDLAEAILAGRRSVSQEYAEHSARQLFLTNLARSLVVSFQAKRRLADLDEAIQCDREALALADPEEVKTLSANLASALQLRFEETTDRADIDDAVDLLREVTEATSPHDPAQAKWLISLSSALQLRALLLIQTGDLAEALTTARRAVAATSEGHPQRAACLSNLAGIQRLLQGTDEALAGNAASVIPGWPSGQPGGDPGELIGLAREALALTPPGHPDRAIYLNNLGIFLRSRGHPGDVAEAVEVAGEAVSLLPVDHQNWLPHMSNLALAFQARFKQTGQTDDYRQAISAFSQAAKAPTGAAQNRLAAALAWGRLAAAEGDTAQAAVGFGYGVSLVPIVAWRGLERSVREENLARWRGVASDAAAWAIRNDQPELAVELLEQGRSVLWEQQLHLRTRADGLADVAPELWRRLSECRDVLDSAGQRSAGQTTSADAGRDRAALRRRAEEWEELVAQVRQIPGFEDFLAPVPWSRLRRAAAAGPVVMVNVSGYGCHALVVHQDQVKAVDLPELREAELAARANAMFAAFRRDRTAAVRAEESDLDEVLTGLLGWLWERVTAPVLDWLNRSGAPRFRGTPPGELPRLWWCPTGILTMLPLHAAGTYSEPRAAVPERTVSSYTPTLSALLRAQAPRSAAPGARLLVGVPDAPGQWILPFVEAELGKIRELVGETTTLLKDAATCEAVLRELSGHSWVHFACHGRQDGEDPGQSAMLLNDGPLTLRQIADCGLTDADLAFLSACQTFTGTRRLADEAIHLASAFQMAGYRHVIATLWSIHDLYAREVAGTVYEVLCQGGTPSSDQAALAVHNATTKLRSRMPDKPQYWAPYAHLGP